MRLTTLPLQVVVPVAIPFLQPDGYKLRPFPIVRANQATVSWNLHRAPLDRLPVLNISPSNAATIGKWFDPHVSSQLSARESALKAAKLEQRDGDPLANLKATLHFLMVRGAGTQGPAPARVIALRDDRTDDSDSDTLFFVDKVRFDVAAHTVVLDAFVLSGHRALRNYCLAERVHPPFIVNIPSLRRRLLAAKPTTNRSLDLECLEVSLRSVLELAPSGQFEVRSQLSRIPVRFISILLDCGKSLTRSYRE